MTAGQEDHIIVTGALVSHAVGDRVGIAAQVAAALEVPPHQVRVTAVTAGPVMPGGGQDFTVTVEVGGCPLVDPLTGQPVSR